MTKCYDEPGTTTQVTDKRGKYVYEREFQPERGSVVLTQGIHGTAWQRHFNDGLWHRTGGGSPKGWLDLTTQRNVVLVYDAPARETGQVQP